MPSGADAFARRKAQQETQRAASGQSGFKADYFAIAPNTYVIVRFLEQGNDLTFADVHRVPVEGRRFPVDFICLNTEGDGTACPACEHPNDKISKTVPRGYLNLIWRDGPVYERNEYGSPKKGDDGKPIIRGRADGVFFWNCPFSVFEDLISKDGKYRGIMSRDWEVKRVGSGTDTKYHIEPADPDGGPQPMMVADMALAERKYDLKLATKPLDYVALHAILHGGPIPDGGPQPTMDQSARLPTAASVFDPSAPPVRASAFTRG